MGQRFVQLDSSYTGNTDGSGVVHVSQLPPNPAILVPGPACMSSMALFPVSITFIFTYRHFCCGQRRAQRWRSSNVWIGKNRDSEDARESPAACAFSTTANQSQQRQQRRKRRKSFIYQIQERRQGVERVVQYLGVMFLHTSFVGYTVTFWFFVAWQFAHTGLLCPSLCMYHYMC